MYESWTKILWKGFFYKFWGMQLIVLFFYKMLKENSFLAKVWAKNHIWILIFII